MKAIFITIFSIFLATCSQEIKAQEETVNWPNPEVEKLYQEGKKLLNEGKTNQAIGIFRQCIPKAPGRLPLYRDLGQALNGIGKFSGALTVVEPMIRQGKADEKTYQVASFAHLKMKNEKKARTTLEDGLEKFPNSASLYCELGNFHDANNDHKDAVKNWLIALEKDPNYSLCYYELAKEMTRIENWQWCVLFGEIFVNLERQTERTKEMKKIIFDGYKKMFDNYFEKGLYKKKKGNAPLDFDEQISLTYQQLTPVMNDGISTENLTMARTRLVMEWTLNQNNKFPFTLFSYLNQMIREGNFDAYNQWLFGAQESQQQFDKWIDFHKTAMPNLATWMENNKLSLIETDRYFNPKK